MFCCFPWSVTVRGVAVDRGLPVAPWKQLAAILRDRITSGELTGRMPSERTLTQEYGLAHGTVRKAIAQLRDEGLVETVAGLGTYVIERGSQKP
jgi:DNA-binding GntR family transcriptional regulator